MFSFRRPSKCQSSYFETLIFPGLLQAWQSTVCVRAVCVCVYSDSCCALELLWGGWSSRPDHPPPFPTFSLLAWTCGLHTHTHIQATHPPPYCAPQIENSYTEGGRDKGSGREPKSSVVSCLTFPAGEHDRWRIGVCSFPSSSQEKTEMFTVEDARCSVKNVFMGHL